MIAAVVLAAGASTRLGKPKQLVMISGETLLERAVRTALEVGCVPVIVVLGAACVDILAHSRLGNVIPVINEEWKDGMASSIRLGVRTVSIVGWDVEGTVLMTCDQPAVTIKHLDLLMRKQEVKASRYAGRNGVPAYFPKKYFDELSALTGDAGARTLLAQANFEDLANGELDIDTVEDLVRARDLFG